MKPEEKAITALTYIIPFIKKYKFKWCISGGFAFYIYGVDRPIGDIDIDIEAEKGDEKFKSFVGDVKKFTTYPFQLWIDKNYDNWVMEVTVGNQKLSICSTKNLKLFNKKSGKYELFYKNGIPKPEIVSFNGLKLPIASKEWVIKMKEALAKKKPIDDSDISGMQMIVNSKLKIRGKVKN